MAHTAQGGALLGRLWLMARFGCCVQVFNDYVAEVTVCVGPSMLPAFNQSGGDIVLCEHLTTRWGRLRRGDVVVATSMSNPRYTVCKRVLGLGGETVRIPDIDVFGAPTTREVTVPPHHVWLQGDNTRNSNDSRHYGPVPTALLRGRVCFRMWPPYQIGPVSADSKFLIHRI